VSATTIMFGQVGSWPASNEVVSRPLLLLFPAGWRHIRVPLEAAYLMGVGEWWRWPRPTPNQALFDTRSTTRVGGSGRVSGWRLAASWSVAVLPVFVQET